MRYKVLGNAFQPVADNVDTIHNSRCVSTASHLPERTTANAQNALAVGAPQQGLEPRTL
jgi:hypothetical protein